MPIPIIDTTAAPAVEGVLARNLYFSGKHNKPEGVHALGFNYGGRGYRTDEYKVYRQRSNKVILEDGTKIDGDLVLDLYPVPAYESGKQLFATLSRRDSGDWKVDFAGESEAAVRFFLSQSGYKRDTHGRESAEELEGVGGQYVRERGGITEWVRVLTDRYE